MGSLHGQATGSIIWFLIVRIHIWSVRGILKNISEEYICIMIRWALGGHFILRYLYITKEWNALLVTKDSGWGFRRLPTLWQWSDKGVVETTCLFFLQVLCGFCLCLCVSFSVPYVLSSLEGQYSCWKLTKILEHSITICMTYQANDQWLGNLSAVSLPKLSSKVLSLGYLERAIW